jgi:NADH dehydrogenase FAD-containing subunit
MEGGGVSASSSKGAVVVGSSFAGMTAALELRKRLDARYEVVVLDPRADFTFIPSLLGLLEVVAGYLSLPTPLLRRLHRSPLRSAFGASSRHGPSKAP